MRYYILTRQSLYPSAKALADKLTELSGDRFSAKCRTLPPIGSRILRWGNSHPHSGYVELGLNDPNLISTASNKLKLSNLLSERDVPCIEFSRNIPTQFPIVVRTTLTGMGGAGIHVCENMEQYENFSGSFWSPWYQFSFELGVHVINGEIVKAMKKVSPSGLDERFPIRNQTRGYEFSLVSLDSFKKLSPAVNNFVSAFPIKFGRLDIGWDDVAKVYRVIEFNTAPSLVHNADTKDLYATKILSLIEER